MQLKNDRYLKAIYRKKIDRTPIWIMRQAGRYLPEYQSVREKYDFITLCKTPELVTEVTLQPIRRFEFDAAILFSDILVVPEAMGQKLEFMENHGPELSPRIQSRKDVESLHTGSIESGLSYVSDAIRMIKNEMNGEIPLIGFSGSPFTLATYMIEGKPTRNFSFISCSRCLLRRLSDILPCNSMREWMRFRFSIPGVEFCLPIYILNIQEIT
jgi:uroporphyrinogen decarboxylase